MKNFFAKNPKRKIILGLAVVIGTAVSYIFLKNNPEKPKISENFQTKKLIKKPVAKKDIEILDDVVDNRRTLYFTFDDGPNNGTENLIEIINEEKIPVTAFVVAKHVQGSETQKKLYKKLEQDTLFEIANHSYSHARNQYSEFYKNPEYLVQDFRNAQDSLKLRTNIVRTPGRNIWRIKNVNSTDIKSSKPAADLLYKENYKVVGWDLEWKPTKEMTLKDNHKIMLKRIDSLFFNNLEKTPRHLVLLTHDQYLRDENSVKELKFLIASLKKSNKFQFKKISEYPEVEGILD